MSEDRWTPGIPRIGLRPPEEADLPCKSRAEVSQAQVWSPKSTRLRRSSHPVSSFSETGDDDVAHLFRLDEESVMAVLRMYE
jgi:hypothetical protein